jgi:replicative DNA helicase
MNKKVRKKKFFSTVQLEKELLHILLKDIFSLRRFHSRINKDWFSDDCREEIFDILIEHFQFYNVCLTREIFLFELDKKYGDSEENAKKKKEMIVEFDNDIALKNSDAIEVIIDKLIEADLATGLNNTAENIYYNLKEGKTDEAYNLMRSATVNLKSNKKVGKVVALHKDSAEWEAEIKRRKDEPEKYAGIKTGFMKFDYMTGGLFPAELTVIFALSGKGKSTALKNIGSRIQQQGFNVLHVCNEENEFQVQTKYHSLQSRIEYNKFKRGSYSDEELKSWQEFNQKEVARGGDIYILEIPQQTDATLIEQAYHELKLQNVHIDVIIVDYLDLMAPAFRAYSENDEQGKVTNDLKQLAINCHCPVLTATQAGTQTEKQETKEKPFLTQSDIFGTKRKAHSANTLIGIVNQTATVGVSERSEEDKLRHRLVFCVPKNRDGACFTFRQLLEAEYGNIIEDPDDPDPLTAKLIERAEQMMEEKEVDASNEKPITDTEIKKYNDNVVSDIAEQVQQAMMQQDSESKSESIENNEVSLNDESSSSSDNVVEVEDKPVEKKNRFIGLLKKTGGKSFGNDFGKQFN